MIKKGQVGRVVTHFQGKFKFNSRIGKTLKNAPYLPYLPFFGACVSKGDTL